jgi:branched-chain amino acid transport system permease protein
MLLSYALTTGLTSGALYALVAVGLVMVYKATGVINIAHGELFMFCGFIAYAAHVQFGLPYFLSFLLAAAAGFGLGALMYQGAFKSLMRSSLANVLIAAIAVSFILKGIARALWGGIGDYIPFPPLFSTDPLALGEVMILPQQIVVVGVAIMLMAALALFFRATRVGKWMQATADNVKAARLVGVRVDSIYLLSFGIGAVIAAVAAVVTAPITLLYPDIGFNLFLKAFAAAVLGGLNSIVGAVLGGVLVGLVETFAATFLHSKFQEVSSFIVIMFALIFMPNGLLGMRRVRKV